MRRIFALVSSSLLLAVCISQPAAAVVRLTEPVLATTAKASPGNEGMVAKAGYRHRGWGHSGVFPNSHSYGSRWGGYHPGYGYGGYPYRHYGYSSYDYSPRYYSYYDPYEYRAYKRYKRHKRRQRAHRVLRHILNYY